MRRCMPSHERSAGCCSRWRGGDCARRALPVCAGQRLVGLVTDRNSTVRATAAGKDSRTATVREGMTKDGLYCFDDQAAGEAAHMMRTQQVRRLLVLNFCGRPPQEGADVVTFTAIDLSGAQPLLSVGLY